MTIDYTELGKRIARRRKALGLKQSEVEEKAGLGQKYLSNIERSINVNIKMYIFDHLRMYIFAILPLDRYIFLSDKIFL